MQDPPKDILAVLDEACKIASVLLNGQKQTWTERQNVEKLEQELHEAICKRNQLAEDLKFEKKMKRINEKKTSKNKDFIRANSLQQRVIDQISEESRIRNAAEISSAFRMTGRSLFHFSENEIGIRLETFYKGSFYETYYIRFRLKLDSNISVHNDDLNSSFIVMHTLPAFIPVDNIGRCYLTQDVLDKDELDLFLREIDLYLSSYVFRREQVKELYKQSYCCDIKVDLELCDSVQFTIRYSEREIYVKLTYDNLKIFYPSKLDAREKTPEWEYRLKQFEHNLQQYSMIDAIQKELFC